MRRPPIWLILGLIGDALAVIGLVGPWLRLYTAYGNDAGEHGFGLWSLLTRGDGALWIVALVAFVFVSVMVAGSTISLVVRARGIWANFFAYLALLLAIVCFTLALFFLITVPPNLPLVWPYFDVRAIDYGAWAALTGFILIAIGALGAIGSIDREEPVWETAGG